MSSSEVDAKQMETKIFLGHAADSRRSSSAPLHGCRQLLLCVLLSLVLAVLVSICCNFILLPKHPTRSICLATATNPICSPTDPSGSSINWTWNAVNCNNHINIKHYTLEILKGGLYVVFMQVTHKPMDLKLSTIAAPFTVLLMKKKHNGTRNELNNMNEYSPPTGCSSCMPHISMNYPQLLEKGDQLYLDFNDFKDIYENRTFWGIYEIV